MNKVPSGPGSESGSGTLVKTKVKNEYESKIITKRVKNFQVYS
jgi:hypothetical protein